VRKIDELACVASEEKPDLILVTESWCHSGISDEFLSIDGYVLQTDLRMDRSDTAQGRGGGLLIYAKNGVVVTKLENSVKFTQYCCFLVHDITVYLIYRSPNANAETMEAMTELVRSVGKNSIMIGDFNLPEVNWRTGETSRRALAFVEAVEDSFMTQMIDFPTHTKGNCLDLLLTNMPERVTEVGDAGRLGSSDHVMLAFRVQSGLFIPAAKRVKNWRRADWRKIREEIGQVDWRQELTGLTTDRMWAVLKRKVDAAVAKHVPERIEACRGRPCWMNQQILAAIRRKKRLWRKVRGGLITEEYKEEDKKVKNLIRNAKRRFEKRLAAKESGSNRQVFAYIKRKTKSR